MGTLYGIFVKMFAVVALCKPIGAEWNTTKPDKTVSCDHHGNLSNCTVDLETQTEKTSWSGHFSECPKEYRHYCIHGTCRFVKEQNTPSCRCDRGHTGSRCEYYDFESQTGDRRLIAIVCVITVLLFFFLLIVFICICTHRRKLCPQKSRKKEERSKEKEGMSMITRESSTLAETPSTDAV